jgi:hypothetical protein
VSHQRRPASFATPWGGPGNGSGGAGRDTRDPMLRGAEH